VDDERYETLAELLAHVDASDPRRAFQVRTASPRSTATGCQNGT